MNNKRILQIITGAALALCLIVIVIVIIFDRHQASSNRQKLLDQQQARFAATATADPLLKYLPYGSQGWNITPTFELRNNQRTLVLNISVIFYGADYNLSPTGMQSLINARKDQALSYIKSKGFDPGKYVITYSTPSI